MRPFASLTPHGQLRRLRRLARTALARWDLGSEPRLRLLNHGENTVYGLGFGDAPELHVLRVHRRGYQSQADLRGEATFLAHLASEGLGVPRPEPTRDGALFAHVATPGVPDGRNVTILFKIPGQRRWYEHWTPTRCRRVGRLIARLHLAAARFVPPAGFARRTLDAEGLVGPTASWGDPLAEPTLTDAERDLFAWGRDRVRAELGRLPRTPDVWGPTHTDLHCGNVLFAAGEARAIDFDDLAWSWYASDFAVNWIPLRWTDPALGDAIFAGYEEVRPLPDGVRELMPVVHCARRLTAVAWARSRADVPRLLEALPHRITQARRTLEAWKRGDDPTMVMPEGWNDD